MSLYNKTITLTEHELDFYRGVLASERKFFDSGLFTNRVLNADFKDIIKKIPDNFVDLLIFDPPYNLNKNFNSVEYKQKSDEDYEEWFQEQLVLIERIIKPTGSIYICCDWKTSPLIYNVAKKYFIPQNRITWEREKGRGAKSNWKNCIEDIWYFTKSTDYYFNLEAVKIHRKVIAPYKNEAGEPKDWVITERGNVRVTHPSNFWSDISVPFWSMPENTEHPTQKPEKLLAKLILASSREGEIVFDPFLGSGTTCVTAKKLGRNFFGIELDERFAAVSLKRLDLAENNKNIQGFTNGIFWERNSGLKDIKPPENKKSRESHESLFDNI